MTLSELKVAVEAAGHERHFFDRKTMKFFGDTMSNYGVRSTVITCNYNEHGQYVETGVQVEVWELYRKRAVKHGLKQSAYFGKASFKQVYARI